MGKYKTPSFTVEGSRYNSICRLFLTMVLHVLTGTSALPTPDVAVVICSRVLLVEGFGQPRGKAGALLICRRAPALGAMVGTGEEWELPRLRTHSEP